MLFYPYLLLALSSMGMASNVVSLFIFAKQRFRRNFHRLLVVLAIYDFLVSFDSSTILIPNQISIILTLIKVEGGRICPNQSFELLHCVYDNIGMIKPSIIFFLFGLPYYRIRANRTALLIRPSFFAKNAIF